VAAVLKDHILIKTVFLKDVGILTESTGYLSCQCCCSPCGDKPKPLGFYGGC